MSPTVTAIREFLVENGLPGGLLPETASAYDFDEATGAFTVRLPGRQERRLAGHRIRYDAALGGRVAHGRLDALTGVRARGPGLWIKVKTIEARGEQLRFHVGPVTRDLPARHFA
jgi:hypothetical protein